MAQPYETRAKTALDNPTFRTAQFRPLIAEGEELARQQRGIAAQAAAESVDFALNETDRDEAAAKSDRARRNAAALDAAVGALKAKMAERRASDKGKAIEAERKAALAERDEIVKRWAEAQRFFPGFVSLLTATLANGERMRAAGINEPNAEAVARKVTLPPPGGLDYSPILRFSEMKIPNFGGPGRCWPPERAAPGYDVSRVKKQMREQAAREAEREAATWTWVRLANGGKASGMVSFASRVILDGRGPTETTKQRGLWKDKWSGGVRRVEAQRLRELGCIVEEIDQVTALREQAAREAEE